MASLCLPNAELHVGVRWQGSTALRNALSDEARPAALLYPGPGAIDIVQDPPKGPITLIVVDGTWWQTKKVVRENPELAALPRYAFTPPAPSEYRIRKEPDEAYVSTIEALMHVLGALEGDPERFRALLIPFRAMIDAQIDCANRLQGARVRHRKTGLPRKPRPYVPPIFAERARDLVCIVGEANAWPYRCEELHPEYPDELVHWSAKRLSTGETFDAIIAPKHPLAPRTTTHVELDANALAAGISFDEFLVRWRAFIRETDVACSWGRYATALFVKNGGHLPESRVDLRHVARVYSKGKVGTLDDFALRVGANASPRLGPGRAGMRLGQVTDIAQHFRTAAEEIRT